MNKSTIESIEWHKNQLFKLLEDNDLVKIEGDIYSVKTDLNEIIEKAKKRVWVKPTATKKGFYREQEVGRKEVSDAVGRTIPPGEMKEKEEMDKNVDRLVKLGVKTGDRVDLGNEVGVFIVKQVNADGTVTCGEGFGKRYPAAIIKNVIKKKG